MPTLLPEYRRARQTSMAGPSAPGATTKLQPASSTPKTTQALGPPSMPGANEPQFDDPSIRRLEQHAINQFGSLTNPAAGGAQQQYEDYLGRYAQQLQGPAYSSGEYSVLTGGALDSIERDKSAQKQRWMEELSRRGIQPSSGVALDGLLQIDNHYAGLRTQTQSGFARDAIQQTQKNQAQAADVYGARAGAEQQRQDQATTYASLPYQLQTESFNRNLALVNGGQASPSNVLDSATQLSSADNNARALNTAQQAQDIQGLLQYLAYLYGDR